MTLPGWGRKVLLLAIIPVPLDLGPVDAGQTAEMDSPVSLTDFPVSPASMVDESLLLASQGTAGVFSQTLHEGLLNSLEAGNSPETSTQAGGLVTVPTMAVSPPLLIEDTTPLGLLLGRRKNLSLAGQLEAVVEGVYHHPLFRRF